MYKCCMELGNKAINKFIAKNLLSCFKCELITCSKSTHAIHQGFPLRLYFLSLLSPHYWRILETGIYKKSLTLSYFWNCSWEFVTLAKVSHLQPFFSPGLMMNKSVLHVASLFSKVYVANTTVYIYLTLHRT